MAARLVLFLFFSCIHSSFSQSAVQSLLQCIKQANTSVKVPYRPIQNADDLLANALRSGGQGFNRLQSFIARHCDRKVEQVLFSANLLARTGAQVVFGGEKAALSIANFLDMGLQNKVIGEKLVQNIIKVLSKYNSKIGRNKSAKNLQDFFTDIKGKINYKPQSSNSFNLVEDHFRNLNFANSQVLKDYILKSFSQRLSFNQNSYKMIYNAIRSQNFVFKSAKEVDEYIRFVLHLDSYTQANRTLLLQESVGFIIKRRTSSLSEMASPSMLQQVIDTTYSYFLGSADINAAIRAFHKQEKYRESFEASAYAQAVRAGQSAGKARLTAKESSRRYSNLRYTCRARGKSSLRQGSAGSYKKDAFMFGVISDAAVYTLNDGFSQFKGKEIFLHNFLNNALMKYVNPKIVMGRSFANMQKALYSYFSKYIGTQIDKKTFQMFIETSPKVENIDYREIIGEESIMNLVDASIRQLETDPRLKDFILKFNKLNLNSNDELSREKIRVFISGQNLSLAKSDEELHEQEQYLLSILASNIVSQRQYAEINNGRFISTGSLSEDREIYLNGYKAFSTLKSLLISQLVYTSMCQGFRVGGRIVGGTMNQAQGKLMSASVFFTNIIGSSILFRLGLEGFTGQK